MALQQKHEITHKAKTSLSLKAGIGWRVGIRYATTVALLGGLMFCSDDGWPETGPAFAQAPGAKAKQPLLAVDKPALPIGKNSGRVGEVDPAIRLLLGRTLEHYPKRGYKEVELGASFEDVNKRTPLDWTETNAPHVLRNSQRGGEDFIFDADQKLVCYTKSYDGGTDDYLDKLVEVFGKTDKEIITRKIEVADNFDNFVTNRTTVNYTFPKVLARVIFVKTARVVFKQVRTEEVTHVLVLDREWATDILEKNAAAKRKNLAWLKKVAAAVRGGDFKDNELPPVPGAKVKAGMDGILGSV